MSVKEKMTALADAIRDKTGKTEALGLDEMAEGVGEVYEAGQKSEYDRFWDAYQDNGNRNIYYRAFCGAGWNAETFKPKYKIVPTSGVTPAQYIFASFGSHSVSGAPNAAVDFTELSNMVDFSKATSVTYAFESAWIKNLTVDFSSATAMVSTFARSNGGDIDNLTIKVSEKCTSFGSAFNNRADTTTIIFTDDSVIAASISFQWSPLLTKESIASIIRALSAVASDKTVTFSKAAKEAAFTDEDGMEWATLIATKPNWKIALV